MSDEAVHYMESTSRLRTENEELSRGKEAWRERALPAEHERDRLRAENEELREHHIHVVEALYAERRAAEATMREVAEELRHCRSGETLGDLADRLDPPPVVEKPLHAYFPSDVNAGSRSPCVHCGQFLETHVSPPVVENPPA